MIIPIAPTRRSHSPSMQAPSINLCNLPFWLILGSRRLHSLTMIVDTKTNGPPPPTAWKCDWLPMPTDTLAGSNLDKLRKLPTPANVTASKNNLWKMLRSAYAWMCEQRHLTVCWDAEVLRVYQSSKERYVACSTRNSCTPAWAVCYHIWSGSQQ